MNVSCEVVMEAISARRDREEGAVADAVVDAHLATCARCRSYAAGVDELSRRMRLRLLRPVPDLVNAIMSSSLGAELGPSLDLSLWRRSTRWLRLDWGHATRWAAAVLPLAVAVPALAFGASTHPQVIPSHLPTPCTYLLHHLASAT